MDKLTVNIHMDSDVNKMINDRLDAMQEEIDKLKRVLHMAVNNFVPGGGLQ